jgi:hypothetical protein
VYWGVYNLVERPDDSFTSQYFGGSNNDWFFTNPGDAGTANSTRWDYLTGPLVAKDMRVPANYLELQKYLNVESFADYVLLSFWMGMTDWPENNWYTGNRNDASPLGPTPGEFFAWDGEWSLDRKKIAGPNGAWVQPQFYASSSCPCSSDIVRIWQAAFDSSDFRALFATRVVLHTGVGGSLTDAAAIARWDALATYTRSAIVAESARWGDSLKSLGGPIFTVTRTRDVDWVKEVNIIRALLQGNQQRLVNQLVVAGLYTP